MQRKLTATYVYNYEKDTFVEYLGLTYKRVEFNVRFDGAQYHAYAVDVKNKISIEIAKHSEEVFHDKEHDRYVVYLNTQDRNKAVRIIAEHIIDRIEMDISYLERKLDHAMAKRQQYLAFRDRELKTD